jgi:hypothetical protein
MDDDRFYYCVEKSKKSPVDCYKITHYDYVNNTASKDSEFVVIPKETSIMMDAFILIARYRRPVRVYPLRYP